MNPTTSWTSPAATFAIAKAAFNASRAAATAVMLAPRAKTMRYSLPPQLDGPLGRIGALEVRLARTRRDVKRAQRLRYVVFHEEMSAIPDMMSRLKRRDIDPFDSLCDHLLVLDHGAPPERWTMRRDGRMDPPVVGAYRLLRHDVAQRHGGFYSESEFDIAPILDANPGKRFLELGRSCVARPYRDKRTVELLWHGIWTYVRHYRIDVMFGCASIEGEDPARLALPLSFLHHHALARPEWRARPVAGRRVDMNLMPKDAIDPRLALHALPPLLKGYLRLGASIGDGAVIDRRFGTVDVLVMLPVSDITPRYIDHFRAGATRHAA